MSYNNFKLRMGLTGGNHRQEQINHAKFYIDSLLPDDPSHKENVEIIDKGFINIRMNNYKLVQGTTPQMNIQASLSESITFNLGDVFFYDNGYWLCVEANDFHSIYKQGKVEECNYYLQWQNPKTLEIHGRWCSVRDPYASCLDENKVITTGNAKYRIKMPHDDETALFHADKRFLIDIANNMPIPYSIIKYDSITNRYAARNEGFLVINLGQSEIMEDDNWDLMIANYKNLSTSTPIPIGACEIRYNGLPIIKAGGSEKSFTATFYNDNGDEITTLSPAWNLLLPPELITNQNIFSDRSGNEIKISASSSAKVGSSFILKMNAENTENGYFESEIELFIESLF